MGILDALFPARRRARDLEKVIRWYGSGDTGSSSKGMALWLSTKTTPELVTRPFFTEGTYIPGRDWAMIPADSGDLGRCIRFLRYMGWEHRYAEMRGCSPAWTAMVEYWPEIVQAYDDEQAERTPQGSCYKLMKRREDEARQKTKLKPDEVFL
jgi:hypothetical protein